MTRVAMHQPTPSPAAVPLESWRNARAKDWRKISRFNALEGSHIMAEAADQIAEDFTKATPPAMHEQRKLWNPRIERFDD